MTQAVVLASHMLNGEVTDTAVFGPFDSGSDAQAYADVLMNSGWDDAYTAWLREPVPVRHVVTVTGRSASCSCGLDFDDVSDAAVHIGSLK